MTTQPDLSARPYSLSVERTLTTPIEVLYLAWTENFDLWFAAPGTLLMKGQVDSPYFFETRFDGQRHPHYGRFLRLVPNKLVELTWVTGDPGTMGAETVVTVEFTPADKGTQVRIRHAGFADQVSRDGHEEAWPMVLEHLEKSLFEFSAKVAYRGDGHPHLRRAHPRHRCRCQVRDLQPHLGSGGGRQGRDRRVIGPAGAAGDLPSHRRL